MIHISFSNFTYVTIFEHFSCESGPIFRNHQPIIESNRYFWMFILQFSQPSQWAKKRRYHHVAFSWLGIKGTIPLFPFAHALLSTFRAREPSLSPRRHRSLLYCPPPPPPPPPPLPLLLPVRRRGGGGGGRRRRSLFISPKRPRTMLRSCARRARESSPVSER